MFEFLDPKYRNTSKLVDYQDHIIDLPGINLEKVDEYIKELNKYGILFNSFLGFNAIPENNIAIRQNLVLAALYHMKGDKSKTKELKEKADNLFINLRSHWMYLEGFSYFRYVKKAYDFYFRFVHQYFAGNVDNMTLLTMMEFYKKICNYDGSVPVNETYFFDRVIPEQERLNFSNDIYSAYFLNKQSTYIFINHNTHINRLSKNLHVNYDFGHFVVQNKGKWVVLHPWYSGYATKSKSPIKESWNNNIIVDGMRTNEPTWRYIPNKPKLEHKKTGSTHTFSMGNRISRKIEILNNGLVVTDKGGEYSSFNIGPDCDFQTFGKMREKIGYHSLGIGDIQTHKRIELSGPNRVFVLNF